MISISSAKRTQYLAALSLLVVSFIDTRAPVDIVVDILYLCSILLVFRQGRRTIISFSAAACILIFLNLLFDHIVQYSLSLWINRGISIFAIIITSYIALHYRKVNREAEIRQQQYFAALQEMLFITSHKVRRPVANIMGLVDVLNTDGNNMSIEELKEYYKYFHLSAVELDDFTRELNNFIQEVEQNQFKQT